MKRPSLRHGLVAVALPAALVLAGCGQRTGVVPPVSAPAQSQPSDTSGAVVPAGAAPTLDPQLESDLNAINDQMNGVGSDLQSSSATPEGDPTQ